MFGLLSRCHSRSAKITSTDTKLTVPIYLISITAAPKHYRNFPASI